jgi:hypothetical protein
MDTAFLIKNQTANNERKESYAIFTWFYFKRSKTQNAWLLIHKVEVVMVV